METKKDFRSDRKDRPSSYGVYKKDKVEVMKSVAQTMGLSVITIADENREYSAMNSDGEITYTGQVPLGKEYIMITGDIDRITGLHDFWEAVKKKQEANQQPL